MHGVVRSYGRNGGSKASPRLPNTCQDNFFALSAIFTYLGSVVDTQGGTEADVKSRIGKARVGFLQLTNIWKSIVLSLEVKIRIVNTTVKALVLLDSAETCFRSAAVR